MQTFSAAWGQESDFELDGRRVEDKEATQKDKFMSIYIEFVSTQEKINFSNNCLQNIEMSIFLSIYKTKVFQNRSELKTDK